MCTHLYLNIKWSPAHRHDLYACMYVHVYVIMHTSVKKYVFILLFYIICITKIFPRYYLEEKL